MKQRLPFVNRIDDMSKNRIKDDKSAATREISYKLETLPSRSQKDSQQVFAPNPRTIKSGSAFAAPQLSVRSDHLWSVNRGGGRDPEHTQSNLG